MGQGQTKASKRREFNGESPSPQKEAKKSPKKSSRSSRSPSLESPTKDPGQPAGEVLPGKPGSESPQEGRLQGGITNGETEQTVGSDVKHTDTRKLLESPPKPSRTFEVDFVEPEKENVPIDEVDGLDVSEIQKVDISHTHLTPSKMNGTHGGREEEFQTPVKVNTLHSVPKATSTPAPNGFLPSRQNGGGPYSDDDHTDISDDEAYSSEQQLRSPSPSASNVSLKSFSTVNSSSLRTKSCMMQTLAGMCLPGRLWHSSSQVQDSSYERKQEVNYGKFYNRSYLETAGSQTYLSRGRTSSDTKSPAVNHFLRPANFSYSKEPPEFLKPKKGGMMQLAQGKTVVKSRRSSSPAGLTGIRKNNEAIKMSTFPGGKRPGAKEIAKIERDDWPAPPSPAAILPEILRQRRKSRGEEDDEDEVPPEDPKIKREIEELKKFKDESGIGTVIYKELEEAKVLPSKLLDPWKASRVPNAAYEPKYQTRYQSPMFASPSRFLDHHRRHAWDDSDLRCYRTMTMATNYPTPKPGYGLAPRAATLPLSGIYGGPLDYKYYDLDMQGTHESRVSNSSINTDTSKVTSTVFDHPGVSLMTFQKSSWHTEAKPPVYPYDKLKISNFDLPKDVDRNQLEIHLVKEEFENIFEMSSEEFGHLPEWKRNDMKRKKDLY